MCKQKIILVVMLFGFYFPALTASYCPPPSPIATTNDVVCNIEITSIENIVCVNSDIITFTIFASVIDGGPQGFTITDNLGDMSSHTYSQLPLAYEMIGNVSSTQVLSFTICDVANPSCCDTYEFENPCYFNCNLSNLEVTTLCQPGTNLFSLSLDFDYTDVSNQFNLYINNAISGTYLYSQLPLTIDNILSDCNISYTIKVQDQQDQSCETESFIGEVCCQTCEIWSLSPLSISCVQGDQVALTFDLNYQGNGSDFFSLTDDFGTIYEFAYADLPLTVEIAGNTDVQTLGVQICDLEFTNCCLFYQFTNPCYDPPVCGISNVVVAPTCEVGSNDFFINVDFEYQNTSSSFDVTINGTNFGTYGYDELPITLFGLEGDCVTSYLVNINDSNEATCSASVTIPAQCCTLDSCAVEIINLSGVICSDGDIATVTFDLDHEDTGIGFAVTDDYGNSSTYTYSQLPVTTTITAPTNEALVGFQVCDIDSPNCCDFIEFANPCYVQPDCDLANMTVVSTCTQGNNDTFDIVVDIDYVNASDSFLLSINGSSGIIYAYTQLPLTVTNLAADCETNYQFVITDIENIACNQSFDLGLVCCTPEPCVMNIESVTNVTCVGGDTLTFTLDLSYSGTDTVGFTIFDFTGNLTFYTYDQLPLLLSMQAPIDAPTVSFIVCDFNTPGCCEIYNIPNPCFLEPVCSVEIVDVVGVTCTNGDIASVTFDLDYVAVGMTGFSVTDDYGGSSNFAYTQLPLTTSITAPTNEQLVGFQVCDIDNPNCCDYLEFLNPCYIAPPPTGNRVITAKVDILRNEKTFAFDMDVVHTLEDDCTFDISVNGQKMATMNKLDKTALLGNFECNSEESFLIAFYSQCINEMVWDTVISHESILCETTTSTEDNLAQTFSLTYDHQSQQVNIFNHLGDPLTVQIVDIYGRRIYSDEIENVSWSTSTQGYISGVYIITAIDKLTSYKANIKLVVTR